MSLLIGSKHNFPFFAHHPELIYLDSAATSQKPQSVIDAFNSVYTHYNGPVRRGAYQIGEQATALYNQARATVAQWLNVQSDEIVFTAGATDGINMVAHAWALHAIRHGDVIVVSALEHHANLLVWQMVAHAKGAELKIIPIDQNGTFSLDNLSDYFTPRTKLLAITDTSHALGIRPPLHEIISCARAVGAYVLLDACQSVPHLLFNIYEHRPDFVVFSAHKMLGPTGIGVLYVARHMHQQMHPYRFGGGMVYEATFADAQWQKMPQLLEAGTPSLELAYALHQAIDYYTAIDAHQLHAHYKKLMGVLLDGLRVCNDIRIIGPIDQLYTGHLVSFVHKRIHFHDVGALLDAEGICVRTGTYCAQPLARALGIDGAVRVSLHVYSSLEDIQKFLEVVTRLTL